MTHDVTIFCRPPEGTPQGTTCWLYYDWKESSRQWIALEWQGDDNDCWDGPALFGANRVARAGWRFHSVAEVPNV